MNNKNKTKKKENLNKNPIDCVMRCPNCNLVPSLNLQYENGNPIINYNCENSHLGNLSLNHFFLQNKKYSLINEICQNCRKSQKELNKDFNICSSCNKFFCFSCSTEHINENNEHNLINFKRYDALCLEHLNYFTWYCNDCKINICVFCHSNHQFHKLTLLSEYNYNVSSLTHLKSQIRDLESTINKIEINKEKMILLFKELKNLVESEINYYKELLSSYEYEIKQNNLNYYIIHNLKNWVETTKLFKIESIHKNSNILIKSLQNFLEYPLNNLKKCITKIKAHNNSITYLDVLKDGRLISSSNDNTLKIYKNISYEIQISINEHSGIIHSFTQLKDERIITCSADKTMKIIKLIGDNQYKIEQTLNNNNIEYIKIIQMKNNLISISPKKDMKLWKLNINDNTFNCSNQTNFINNKSNDTEVTFYINSSSSSFSYNNILKINKKEFSVFSKSKRQLSFFLWEPPYFSQKYNIDNIESEGNLLSMSLINDDILCVGGNKSKGFYLIRISTHLLIKNIIGPNKILSINQCLDGLLLCYAIYNKLNFDVFKLEYKKENLKHIFGMKNKKEISLCIELKDQTIAIGFTDGIIEIWGK